MKIRRAAAQRRARRRRAALGAVLLSVIGVLIALVVVGTGSAHRRSVHALASRSEVKPAKVAARERAAAAAARARTLALWQATAVRVLNYTSYMRLGTPAHREMALTFDDGPGPYTPKILRVLQRTHTPATFFAIGEWAKRYPQYVREEARLGSEVGDHTETHPFMSLLSPETQRLQVLDAANAIRDAGAPFPSLWRPPYGSFNQETLGILHELGMVIVLWSVDTSDYARPGAWRIAYTALSGARPGAIILMHDGGGNRAETVEALPRIIAGLRRRGFRLVTVSQLMADDPPPHGQRQPTSLAGAG